MLFIIQPAMAIQPMIGMIAISPWRIIFPNQPGLWNGHAKLSAMLLIDEEFNWVDVEIPDFARWPALTSESDSARECLATSDIAQVDAPVESTPFYCELGKLD
jgi:hypothetical protein